MRPIERLGKDFAPVYKARPNGEAFEVTVTPPAWVGLPPVSVLMTSAEFAQFQLWRARRLMIQEAFPDWSPSKRELLQTGITDMQEFLK